MEKKGQGLSINAIILIILGVAVLVILVLGFTTGWDQFAFWVPGNNVATVVKSCELACSSQSGYDYCSLKRELKSQEGKFQNITCYALAYGDGLSKYEVKRCSSVNCKEAVSCNEWEYNSPSVKGQKVVVTENNVPVTENYCKK